jgi:hypothetical protein
MHVAQFPRKFSKFEFIFYSLSKWRFFELLKWLCSTPPPKLCWLLRLEEWMDFEDSSNLFSTHESDDESSKSIVDIKLSIVDIKFWMDFEDYGISFQHI